MESQTQSRQDRQDVQEESRALPACPVRDAFCAFVFSWLPAYKPCMPGTLPSQEIEKLIRANPKLRSLIASGDFDDYCEVSVPEVEYRKAIGPP